MSRLALASLLAVAGCRTPEPYQSLLGERRVEGARTIGPGLWLQCAPEDAQVTIDSVPQGSCADFKARVFPLDEGPHHVEVEKAGLRPYRAEVTAGRARTRLEVQLAPREASNRPEDR